MIIIISEIEKINKIKDYFENIKLIYTNLDNMDYISKINRVKNFKDTEEIEKILNDLSFDIKKVECFFSENKIIYENLYQIVNNELDKKNKYTFKNLQKLSSINISLIKIYSIYNIRIKVKKLEKETIIVIFLLLIILIFLYIIIKLIKEKDKINNELIELKIKEKNQQKFIF